MFLGLLVRQICLQRIGLSLNEEEKTMKIDWKRKLTSRKLWLSIAGFVAGLIVIFGGSQENADKVSGAI